jgi:hypothetical protein
MTDQFLFITVPTVVGVSALALGALRRQHMFRWKKTVQKKQLAAQAEKAMDAPPEGATWVQEHPIPVPPGFNLTGTTMLTGNGSVGCIRSIDSLIALYRVGADKSNGSAFLHECDARLRARIDARIPSVYRDRIVWAYADDFPEGFGNLPPEKVERLFGRWSVQLKDGVDRVARLHEERNGKKPGQICLFISLGGHAFPGVTLVEELSARFPDTRIVGIMNLPRKEDQREYFLTLKERYERAGVTGWLVGDRMEQDNITQDSVVPDIIAGFETASIVSDGAIRFNNVMTGVTGENGGGVARFEYIYGEVVAHRSQPDPTKPPKYYVYRQQVISELRNLLEKAESGKTKVSLDMSPATDKRQTYDLVLAAVSPADMLDIRDYIERAREEDDTQLNVHDRPHLHPKPNYETVYTSWSQAVNPDKPRCQVCVIRIRPIENSDDLLSEMVKVPQNRRSANTLVSYEPALPASVNGHDEDYDWQ